MPSQKRTQKSSVPIKTPQGTHHRAAWVCTRPVEDGEMMRGPMAGGGIAAREATGVEATASGFSSKQAANDGEILDRALITTLADDRSILDSLYPWTGDPGGTLIRVARKRPHG